MANVTIRELRNKGGDVVERASRGEQITICLLYTSDAADE